MGEPFRHVEHAAVTGGDSPPSHRRNVREAARTSTMTSWTAPLATNEIHLVVRRRLIVEAAERASARIERDASLDDARIAAVRFELPPTPGSGEEAAGVLSPLDVDDESPGERRLVKDHPHPRAERSRESNRCPRAFGSSSAG